MHERPFAAHFDPELAVLRLAGVLDGPASGVVAARITEATARHTRPVAVDVSDVDLLTGQALGVLAVAASAMAPGCPLTVRTVRGTLAHRVLRISGLAFTVVDADRPRSC